MPVGIIQLDLYIGSIRPLDTRCQPPERPAVVLYRCWQECPHGIDARIVPVLSDRLAVGELNTGHVSNALKSHQSSNARHLAFRYTQIEPFDVVVKPCFGR